MLIYQLKLILCLSLHIFLLKLLRARPLSVNYISHTECATFGQYLVEIFYRVRRLIISRKIRSLRNTTVKVKLIWNGTINIHTLWYSREVRLKPVQHCSINLKFRLQTRNQNVMVGSVKHCVKSVTFCLFILAQECHYKPSAGPFLYYVVSYKTIGILDTGHWQTYETASDKQQHFPLTYKWMLSC